MQIYELAKKHEMKAGEMLALIKKLGFPVKNHMSVVTAEINEAVIAKLHPQPTAPETEAKTDSPTKEPEKVLESPEEVIFFSPSRSHNIAYKKEAYFGNTAKIKDRAESIQFEDYTFRTSDPEKIEHIKSTRSFKVRSTSYPNGKIRIVNEAELAKLKKARQPRVTEVKSTSEKALTDDINMNRFNEVPI